MTAPTPIRAAVVDDEPPARDRIRWLLRDVTDVQLVAEYGDVAGALAGLRREPVDLLFLDVRMPGGDGISLLEKLGESAPEHVILVTAFEEYALRAFELEATDYLLKPFDPARFHGALDRVRRQLQTSEGEPSRPAIGGEQARAGVLDRLAVRSGGRILLIPAAEVDWLGAEGNYVRVRTGPRSYLLRETLTALERRLDPARFARIHRSTIVNLERIRELQPLFHGEMAVVLVSGERLTLSRKCRRQLRGRWGQAV